MKIRQIEYVCNVIGKDVSGIFIWALSAITKTKSNMIAL